MAAHSRACTRLNRRGDSPIVCVLFLRYWGGARQTGSAPMQFGSPGELLWGYSQSGSLTPGDEVRDGLLFMPRVQLGQFAVVGRVSKVLTGPASPACCIP